MDSKNLISILEVSEMLVGDEKDRFIDASLLMYIARYNEYHCEKDVRMDGKTPRKVKLQIHIYVEDLPTDSE